MASVADPLLAGEKAADSEVDTASSEFDAARIKPAFYKKCYFTFAGLSLVSLGLMGFVYKSSQVMIPKPSDSLMVEGWGDSSCYSFTGGTCVMTECYDYRNATCIGDRCVCANGCTGADGGCRNDISSYRLVGKNVRFRNVKFSDQYLYAPRTWFMEQLRTTESKGKYADLWNVYKMPGKDFMWGHEMYMLSPVEFPEYAAGVSDTKMSAYIPSKDGKGNTDGGIVVPVGSMFIVSLYHLTSRHWLANKFPFNIAYVMNSLCRPNSHPEAVQINGALGTASWYIHHASWEVFGWVWSDPGEGGYWVPDSPLDDDIPVCKR